MKPTLTPLMALVLGSLAMVRAHGAGLNLDIEIPPIDTAEYHRPYVAIWLENKDRTVVRDLSVWYQQSKGSEEGKKWLKDLRRWWRISGRNQDEPADGVSGATKAVGKHSLQIASSDTRLKDLPAGEYSLAIEAAREKGGHELVRLTLPWPASAAQTSGPITVTGERELGEVSLRITP